jgi:hypothetical protein
LSSAILYLAIVAIWAVVLVPRWLRHPHTAPQLAEAQGEEIQASGQALAAFDDGTRVAAPARQAPRADVSRDTGADPAARPQHPRAGPDSERAPAPASLSPAARRARILRARRRTLSTLVLLATGALVLAVAHLAAWWVAVPPGVMLAGFLLLLREAARIDAERATDQAHADREDAGQQSAGQRDAGQHGPEQERGAARATPAARRPAAAEADHAAPAAQAAEPGEDDGYSAQQAATAGPPEPGAEIIDISARIGDQLYDQYTDAEARAIGD